MSKCKKCGADIPDNVKFCPECGAESSGTSVNGRIVMKCQQCSGTLTMDKEGDILVCPYCGSKELLLDSENVAVEKIKQQTEFKKWEREELKEEKVKKEQEEQKYKFGAFSIISIVCAALFGIMAVFRFTNIKNAWVFFAGLFALIGAALFVASVLFRRGILKTEKSYLPTILMICGFFVFIPFSIFNSQATKSHSSYSSDNKEYTWPDSDLAAMLPKPKSTYGKIHTDSATSLWIDVANTSQSDFDEYISQCKEKGFTEDYYRSDTSYEAKNKDNYSLDLYLYSDGEMRISLDAPEPKTTAAPTEAKAKTQPPTQKTAPTTVQPTTAQPTTVQPTTKKAEIFPQENAKRAAVVTLTNGYADDVYADDGFSIDKSKLHSYSDLSGFYILVDSWGSWKEKNENTWHVDSLKGKNSYGSEVNASLDVKFDGNNYIVSNITGNMGNNDLKDIEETTSTKDDITIVSPQLIKDDRDSSDIQKNESKEDKIDHYYAKKAFEKYGEAMYPYGFKCHWILNLIADEKQSDGYYFKVGVTIKNGNNAKMDAVAEGIVKGTNDNPIVENFSVY